MFFDVRHFLLSPGAGDGHEPEEWPLDPATRIAKHKLGTNSLWSSLCFRKGAFMVFSVNTNRLAFLGECSGLFG